MDWKIELIPVPVTDVDRAKEFYETVGFNAEAARRQLLDAGVEASEVDAQPWGNFVHFRDPDGNRWSLQAIPWRSNG